MSLMKKINTAFHNNGMHAFDGRPKLEKEAVWAIIRSRHELPKRPEVIGNFVVMLGEMVSEPSVEGNYNVIDPMTDSQQLVRVYQENFSWYVIPSGSMHRMTLSHFNQQYYRWIHLHPIPKDVLNELRRQ